MKRSTTVRPTPGELEILGVLWRQGPSTVRQVHDALRAHRATGYTTVLKLMQIMADKGLVARDMSRRPHVYAARLEEGAAQRSLVRELIARAFGGSAARLAVHALSSATATDEELAEVRRLLDQIESRKGGPR
jgi:predicted transcriptional regulator